MASSTPSSSSGLPQNLTKTPKSNCTILATKPKCDEQSERMTAYALHDELITIDIHDCAKPYIVSITMLFKASPYFVKALENGFMETRTRRLRIPGCDAATFEDFVHCAMNDEVPASLNAQIVPVGRSQYEDEFQQERSGIYARLINLWVFGDAYFMPRLQNGAMKALIRWIKEHALDTQAIKLAFNSSGEDSVLRKVMVDMFAFQMYHSGATFYDREEMDELGAIPGFLYEVEQKHMRCRNNHGSPIQILMSLMIPNIKYYMVPEGVPQRA